jgi:hypothetical protein
LTPNKPELYDLLPIERTFDRTSPLVNGGVSAWRKRRDAGALDAYIHVVTSAACDPRVMDAVSWHDQGALIWAIQALSLEGRVLGSSRWNLAIDNVALPPETLAWDDGLTDRLRSALPDVGLVHWNGRPLPWLTNGS